MVYIFNIFVLTHTIDPQSCYHGYGIVHQPVIITDCVLLIINDINYCLLSVNKLYVGVKVCSPHLVSCIIQSKQWHMYKVYIYIYNICMYILWVSLYGLPGVLLFVDCYLLVAWQQEGLLQCTHKHMSPPRVYNNKMLHSISPMSVSVFNNVILQIPSIR